MRKCSIRNQAPTALMLVTLMCAVSDGSTTASGVMAAGTPAFVSTAGPPIRKNDEGTTSSMLRMSSVMEPPKTKVNGGQGYFNDDDDDEQDLLALNIKKKIKLPFVAKVSDNDLNNISATSTEEKVEQEEEEEPRWVEPEHVDVCPETGITLGRYMTEMSRANPDLKDLESIMMSLQTATKTISSLVQNAPLTGMIGLEDDGGSINVQGEEQKKLDVVTNDVLKRSLKWTGKLGVLASEEEDKPVTIDTEISTTTQGENNNNQDDDDDGEVVMGEEGNYVAVFDPLDGSSNVDAGIAVGTIFGIFKNSDECIEEERSNDKFQLTDNDRACIKSTLQPGTNLVAAGYCLYSSSTMLVLTMGNGVQGFTLDQSIGEYVLTHPNIKIPQRGNIYSFKESNRHQWSTPMQNYLEDIQQGRSDSGEMYSSRYIGSMVADIHRTLLYGGIFGYLGDNKNPNGKLRLLYEAAPMAFLMEQAGGKALTTGCTGTSCTNVLDERIMDVQPTKVHQRVQCVMGSPLDVSELQGYFEYANDPELIDPKLKAREEERNLLKQQQNNAELKP